ncbi:hypothetical protein HAX54_044754 [Datura stramonium]|uniref:Uncharacterized protein n=1 Tax=Datura stramonium TaxID=4076 RepID=A0ABS8WJV1_DATST|nr:hypothetical protein [Datura stramonium]
MTKEEDQHSDEEGQTLGKALRPEITKSQAMVDLTDHLDLDDKRPTSTSKEELSIPKASDGSYDNDSNRNGEEFIGPFPLPRQLPSGVYIELDLTLEPSFLLVSLFVRRYRLG